MNIRKVKIEIYIPEEYTQKLREALNDIGALGIGNYDNVMSQTTESEMTLREAAIRAAKELGLKADGLDGIDRPEFLSEVQWIDVLERAKHLL